MQINATSRVRAHNITRYRTGTIVNIKDIYNPDVVTCAQDASIQVVADLMRRLHVGDVIVVDANQPPRPVGIVTDRDLVVELIAEGAELDTVCAGDVMSWELVSIDVNANVTEALQSMRVNGIRRLPVIERGRLIGQVSRRDLLEAAAALLRPPAEKHGADTLYLSPLSESIPPSIS